MKLKGKRTGIGFTIGTLLVIMCLYFTKDNPENFQGILFIWMTIFGVFVGTCDSHLWFWLDLFRNGFLSL